MCVRQVLHVYNKSRFSVFHTFSTDQDGSITVKNTDRRIPFEVIKNIQIMMENGATLQSAIEESRSSLLPPGYKPYSFRRDVPESYVDCLRSLIATLYYRYEVAQWKEQGVDFTAHLYVPEINPITGAEFHERGDHNHILKRIACHTREGKCNSINYTIFDDAMRDKDSGLTHAALVGLRKQSVGDAERLLSFHVAEFLWKNGHTREAEYVQVIADWHASSDGRGLSQLTRCRNNYKMLQYLLDELMPWHKTVYDFSFMDINR